MGTERALIGRETERARLRDALERAAAGAGSLTLVAGDAGVGKTRLVDEVAAADADGLLVLRGAATSGHAEPHAPLAAVLRAYLHAHPGGLADCGPLGPHLALLLPELGDPPPAGDRATLLEALRCALATVARAGPALVILDDLHWSDDATLDALAALAGTVVELPLAVVALYRSDELSRDHPVRRLRAELRRSGAFDEVVLEPLPAEATRAIAEHVLGDALSDSLARTIHDRTQGVPFFAEELTDALRAGGLLRPGPEGLELEGKDRLPVPSTVRDAVLMRLAAASPAARAAAEAAAVAGERFDLDLVAGAAGADGLLELAERGLIVETEPGSARFRHALVRDAVYDDVPWLRRRDLHRRLAGALAEAGGSAAEVAAHWLGARDERRAREALLVAAREFCSVHAYRDAARVGRRALDHWPESEDPDDRADALERYAHCAELGGDVAEAVRAWRELAAIRRAAAPGRPYAEVERRLACAYELRGDRDRAMTARRAAAEAFAADGLLAEAAAERLATATHLQSAGSHAAAVDLARAAGEEARAAARLDLLARAMGLEGVAMAKRGEFDAGLERVRAGLSLALEHDLTPEAAEVYQRLGTTLETAADYRGAHEALESALGFCDATGARSQGQGCVSCIAYVLRELGDWDRAAELCGELVADPELGPGTRVVADGVLGAIHAFRGDLRPARELLDSGLATAKRLNILSMGVDCAAALAWTDAIAGDTDAVLGHCRFLLDRWSDSEDHHYAVWGLRLASSLFAEQGAGDGVRACADALGRIATASGHADALAALAHALGESALLDGDADGAAEQLLRAVDLHRELDIPFERAHIGLRAGVACAAAGERDVALDRLGDAYRTARRLGAAPLATRAAAEVAKLGEPLVERLGRRAAAAHEGAGLTRRELEVIRRVAVGLTNREIAGELFLSPRTVDMHVRNILGKLGCRSRVEATSRAHALGLVE